MSQITFTAKGTLVSEDPDGFIAANVRPGVDQNFSASTLNFEILMKLGLVAFPAKSKGRIEVDLVDNVGTVAQSISIKAKDFAGGNFVELRQKLDGSVLEVASADDTSTSTLIKWIVDTARFSTGSIRVTLTGSYTQVGASSDIWQGTLEHDDGMGLVTKDYLPINTPGPSGRGHIIAEIPFTCAVA